MSSHRKKAIAAAFLFCIITGTIFFYRGFIFPMKTVPRTPMRPQAISARTGDSIPAPVPPPLPKPAIPIPAPEPKPPPVAPPPPPAAEVKPTATDTAPVMSAEEVAALDDLLESADKAPPPEAGTEKNTALHDKIATEAEKKVVEAWQDSSIEHHEDVKNKDWAGYHTSPEHRVMGLWLMGNAGAIVFYKDGTGQVSYDKEDHREQTLTGNFYFRYRIKENIVEIIPILTKDSKRTITCHFLMRIKDNTLFLGPYTYTSLDPKKKQPQ